MEIFPQGLHPLEKPQVQALLELGSRRGAAMYLVGGYLRDALLGRLYEGSLHDLDFVVQNDSARQLSQVLADKVDGRVVVLDEQNDTVRVILDDGTYLDLAGCVGPSLETDVHRRDFTINALAWDPCSPDEVIDRVGGLQDLEVKRVRAVSQQSLIDDPLRLLRAFRFAASLDFFIEETTAAWIQAHHQTINGVAPERITTELFLLLESEVSGPHFRAMGACGLLEEIFPELKPTRAVTPNSFHHLGLFDHSVEALVQSELTQRELPSWAKEQMRDPVSAQLTRLAAAKLACLLHDIGKPDTWVITDEGRHTFIGHDKVGAAMCGPLARRLRFPRPVERFIEKLVRWHLRPGQLFHQGDPTEKALYRFFRTIDHETPELVLLALSDFRSTCGPGLQEGRQDAERKLFELLPLYSVYRQRVAKQSKLLDGNEVMNLLGIRPGPIVGQILEELREAQGLQNLKSRKQAEDFVKSLYDRKYS